MGLSKRDRKRITEIGFRQWMSETANAQLVRMAKAKKKAQQKGREAA
jgi:hypothetical protein